MRLPIKVLIFGVVLLTALPLAERAAPTPAPAAAAAKATCSFSNVRYSGWCRVTEDVPEGSTADEACQKVLNCLNDTGCTKTYCNATDIRGGWKLEKVEAQ